MNSPTPSTLPDEWAKQVLRNSALGFIAHNTYTRVDERLAQGLLNTLDVLSKEEQFTYTAGMIRFVFLTGVTAGRELQELKGGEPTNRKLVG